MKKTLLLIFVSFAFIALNAQTAINAASDKTAEKNITPAKVVENPNAPEITFENLIHDYGTLQKGDDGNTEFKFTNTGKEPLILSDVKTS